MKVFRAVEEIYTLYGVKESRCILVAVRPDGVVGMVPDLEDIQLVVEFLG